MGCFHKPARLVCANWDERCIECTIAFANIGEELLGVACVAPKDFVV